MRGSKRDTVVKSRFLDYVGEDEGGVIWKNNIEACILPYEKYDKCKFDMWRTLKAGALGKPRGVV